MGQPLGFLTSLLRMHSWKWTGTAEVTVRLKFRAPGRQALLPLQGTGGSALTSCHIALMEEEIHLVQQPSHLCALPHNLGPLRSPWHTEVEWLLSFNELGVGLHSFCVLLENDFLP